MNPLLHDLQKKQLVWRAANIEQHKERISTSYQTLDKALNGGFPNAGLIHLKSQIGLGEMRLVLPAIKDKQKFCAFIAAPYLLNAEFLIAEGIDLEKVLIVDTGTRQRADKSTNKHITEQTLWSAEQCAKSGACTAVFIWHTKIHPNQAKKLELAALKGQCLIFLFENPISNHASKQSSEQSNLPVSLALSLEKSNDQHTVDIKIDKQKVGWPIPKFSVKVPFKARMGSPMHREHRANRPSLHAANVYALHSKHS